MLLPKLLPCEGRSLYMLLGGCFLILMGCALPRPEKAYPTQISRTYTASYEATWSALLKVLDAYQYKYPSANKDAGYLETDFLKGESDADFYYSGGEKFHKETKLKFKIWVSKSEDITESTPIKVTLQKEFYINSGFLEGWEPSKTDLLIEEIILYRIGRVIELDKSTGQLTTPSQF